MDSSFGALDAFALLVFAVLIFVGVIIVVSLGKLPGQLAYKWEHPQAGAINAMGSELRRVGCSGRSRSNIFSVK
jgi:hypothetical protein